MALARDWPDDSSLVFYFDEHQRKVQTTTQIPSWLSDLSDEVDDLIDELDEFASRECEESREHNDEGDTE